MFTIITNWEALKSYSGTTAVASISILPGLSSRSTILTEQLGI